MIVDTLLGESTGRRDDRSSGRPSEATVGVQPPGQAAGHGHRPEADVEALVGAGEADHHLLEVERAAGRIRGADPAAGRVDEEVEHDLLALRGPGQQEAAARRAR